MTADDSPAPAPAPASPAPPAAPFSFAELRAAVTRPARILEVVLGERARFVASVGTRTALAALLFVLGICSIAGAAPFAAVDGWRRLGDVALLFLGSVLICFPALQVFGAYLALRRSVAQNLAVALLIPAAAALFTLGFAPIYWFLDATMPAGSGVTTHTVLLTCSLLLALSHINRCLYLDRALDGLRASWWLWAGWQALLVFITFRMADTLGLLA